MSPVQVLERQAYRTPLAVLCQDGVTGATVLDGLVATAWRRSDPSQRFTARRSPVSGIYSFGFLPRQWANTHVRVAPGQPVIWPPSTPEAWCLLVEDNLGRYLPTSIAVNVPVTAPVTAPLSSAPTRLAGDATAVVRGEIHHDGTGDPLGWALIRIDTGTAVYQTVADDRGRFRIQAPYPEALPALGGSTPSGPGLSSMTWPLTVTALSQPAALVRSPGLQPTDPPELASITSQSAAQLVDGGSHPALTETLQFGTDLVLSLSAVPA
jgi:hypothetical protein